jgi:hypothetical protein
LHHVPREDFTGTPSTDAPRWNRWRCRRRSSCRRLISLRIPAKPRCQSPSSRSSRHSRRALLGLWPDWPATVLSTITAYLWMEPVNQWCTIPLTGFPSPYSSPAAPLSPGSARPGAAPRRLPRGGDRGPSCPRCSAPPGAEAPPRSPPPPGCVDAPCQPSLTPDKLAGRWAGPRPAARLRQVADAAFPRAYAAVYSLSNPGTGGSPPVAPSGGVCGPRSG